MFHCQHIFNLFYCLTNYQAIWSPPFQSGPPSELEHSKRSIWLFNMESFYSSREQVELLLNRLFGMVHHGSVRTNVGILGVVVAVLIAFGYGYLLKARTSQSPLSTKGQQAKALKSAFEKAESLNGSETKEGKGVSTPTVPSNACAWS